MLKEQDKITIKVARSLAAILSSRDVISELSDSIKNTKVNFIELDFSNVEFISRSAAHELLSLKEDLSRRQNDKKELSFVNTNPDITNMLRIVAANRALPRRDVSIPKIERTNLDSLLKRTYI